VNEVRLNILDARGAMNGIVHCGLAEGAMAALSAEPETIAELEAAIERFIRRQDNDGGAFNSFKSGEDFDQWDQGTAIIDLAARVVATKSLYCTLQWRGDVEYYKGDQATGVWLPYCIPEDWLLLHSTENGVEVRDALTEYKANRDGRRAERAANEPIDVRAVLYGIPMIRFVADACTAAKNRRAAEGFGDSTSGGDLPGNLSPSAIRLVKLIHGRWLMTPRVELRGRTPRDVTLEKIDFIESDLLTREIQWELLGEAALPIARDSYAYRFAGFGSHEFVVYHHLLRHLLRQCLTRLKRESESEAGDRSAGPHSTIGGDVDQSSTGESLLDWLQSIKEEWLNEPNAIFEGRIPSAIIEIERRRIPLPMSEEETLREEGIPEEVVERIITKINIARSEIKEGLTSYRLMDKMEGEGLGPEFKYFDLPESEAGFVFSIYRTREEWKGSEIKRRDLDARYDDIRARRQETTLEEGEEGEDGQQVH